MELRLSERVTFIWWKLVLAENVLLVFFEQFHMLMKGGTVSIIFLDF